MPAIQLSVLVLDASGSMNETVSGAGANKAWQIEDILCRPLSAPIETAPDKGALLRECGLIARLQYSQRKDLIDLGIIRYDTRAQAYQKVRPVTDWELSPPGTRFSPPDHYMLGGQNFDLLEGMGGNTNIEEALKAADNMKDQWFQYCQQNYPNHEQFVSIILMSDMLHNEGSMHGPIDVANQIKSNVELRGRPQVLLAGAAFGDNADLDMMKKIATPGPSGTPDKYAIKTTDPIKLRDFFLASATAQLG